MALPVNLAQANRCNTQISNRRLDVSVSEEIHQGKEIGPVIQHVRRE